MGVDEGLLTVSLLVGTCVQKEIEGYPNVEWFHAVAISMSGPCVKKDKTFLSK